MTVSIKVRLIFFSLLWCDYELTAIMKLYVTSKSTYSVQLNSIPFLERKKSAYEITKLSLCQSIMALNQIFTNCTKLMPLETSTTLSFLQLVISTWWTWNTCELGGKHYEFCSKEPIIWEKTTKTSLLGYKKKLIQTILIPFRENITFICAKENMHFWVSSIIVY